MKIGTGDLTITISGPAAGGKTHLAQWLVGHLSKMGHELVFNDHGLGANIPVGACFHVLVPDSPRRITVNVVAAKENEPHDVVLDALAGYKSGVHEIGGVRVIVKTGPKLVDPQPGDWGTVKALINNLLKPESGAHDQSAYFHGWMKMAVESLYLAGPESPRPGQACIFAGPAASGKSLIQNQIVSGLLGGLERSANPEANMSGCTDFNGEMFGAEHLLMEDPVGSTLTEDRVFFGEMVKKIVVGFRHQLHQKGDPAFMVSPFWRLTISVNDDPDRMRGLPMLTPDMRDKIMLFHVEKCELPMLTETLDERRQFREQIAKELPAYAHYLLNDHVIDPDMVGLRFGIKEFHHPRLVRNMADDLPAHKQLLGLIDEAVFDGPEGRFTMFEPLGSGGSHRLQWSGKASVLSRVLLGETGNFESSVRNEVEGLFKLYSLTRMLQRLAEEFPDRVKRRRKEKAPIWEICAPDRS